MHFDSGELIYRIIVLFMVAAGVLAHASRDWKKAGKQMAAWVVIIAVVTAAAVYWDDVKNSKFAASLVPGHAQIGKGGEMKFAKAADGHFYINAEVDGKTITFMVDTGAADIVLTREDAAKIGVDISSLKFNKFYSTANGTTRGASYQVKSFKVADFEQQNIWVSVNEGEMDGSLLGMQFLNALKSYRFEGNTLVIKQP